MSPHPTRTATDPTRPRTAQARCRGCGQGARTRSEAADLSVPWLVYDPATQTAIPARFHHRCRPAGVPGDGACGECGDGPLIEATLHEPTDLLTAAAISTWQNDHGWTHSRQGWRCPTCGPGRTQR